jgi:hypothetical protein
MMLSPIKKEMAGDRKSMSIIVENNTLAMQGISKMICEHDERLDNHQDRLVKIETVHDIDPHTRRSGDLP